MHICHRHHQMGWVRLPRTTSYGFELRRVDITWYLWHYPNFADFWALSPVVAAAPRYEVAITPALALAATAGVAAGAKLGGVGAVAAGAAGVGGGGTGATGGATALGSGLSGDPGGFDPAPGGVNALSTKPIKLPSSLLVPDQPYRHKCSL